MRLICFLVLIIKIGNKFTTTEMNPKNQFERKIIQLEDDSYQTNSCLSYGVWQKFNPLSAISQVGLLGIFDSHCFHLHNAIDFEQQNLNILYFDCLNYESKKIIKTVQFINNQNQYTRFDLVINSFDYENTWYFLQVAIWPKLDRVQLIVTKKQEVLLQTTQEIKKILKDVNLILTFGGNLLVNDSKINELQYNQQFSYFPGPIWLQEVSIQILNFDFNFVDVVKETYQAVFETCVCNPNEIYKMKDQDFVNQQQQEFISENSNCDSFILRGWVRIKENKNQYETFSYQLIKVSAIQSNPKLQNYNLYPFQLFYHFFQQSNEMEITTYNYTFPDVSLDFSDNPFLLKKKFLILGQVTLWHFIKVELLKSKLIVKITFYGEEEINKYNLEYEVNQFHNCQFQVQFGDSQIVSSNGFIFQVRNFEFFNCYQELAYLSCHFSCQDCNGPTNQDCLSCSQESKRIYLPEYKVCICPYFTIDNENQCQDYKDSNLKLTKDETIFQSKNCEYGYFEFDGVCLQCPSIIKEGLITCYECLINPQNWYQNPTCVSSLVLEMNTSFMDALKLSGKFQFYFDGNQLNVIHQTQFQQFILDLNLSDPEGILKEFSLAQMYFNHFCQKSNIYQTNELYCYQCLSQYCLICQILVNSIKCVKCDETSKLIDGNCIREDKEVFQNNELICLPPFYASFEKKCKLCEIKNCLYCFEYSAQDQNFCSLLNYSQNQLYFIQDVKIGCALCKQDYIFDFSLGFCLLQKPQIENCLSSFININSKELTSNFQLLDLISNCQQCTIMINRDIEIRCVTCQSNCILENNNCYQNDEFDINTQLLQNQVNQIQSFILQFVPQLQSSVYNEFLDPQTILQDSCDPECGQCVTQSYFSNCLECPLDYFKKPVIRELSAKCSFCPPLCQACIDRSDLEIQNISPNFKVNNQNQLYSKKCIYPHKDSAIMYNPYSHLIKYCFNNICQNKFVFELNYYSCDFSRFNRNYENKINTQYINQIGIEELTFEFLLDVSEQFCYLIFPLSFKTELKQKIFTLQKVNFNLSSIQYLEIINYFIIEFNDFDQIEINNLGFVIGNDCYFLFNKQQDTINNIYSLFATERFGDITLRNFTIQNTIFLNSSIFNFQQQFPLGSIKIVSLLIKNCTFIQSTLFNFSQIHSFLSINQLMIFQSYFRNSSIISILNNQPQQGILIGDDLKIRNTSLVNSNLINSTGQIRTSLNNLDICNNLLESSTIISISSEISLSLIIISETLFVFSQFLSIKQILYSNNFRCNITNLDAIKNDFTSSNIIFIFSSLQTNSIQIQLINFNIKQNTKYSSKVEIIQLFYINSFEILIENFEIVDNHNFTIFYLSENKKILFSNILFQNSFQNQKIGLSQDCLKQKQKTKLLDIMGFNHVYLINVSISRILNVDESIIQINPSQQSLSFFNSIIEITNLQFTENTLIQSTFVDLISCLIIETDNKVIINLHNISYVENFIHSYSSGAVSTIVCLIYILSSSSVVEIKNLLYENNALTNTSNSFMIIRSDTLMMSNFSLNNLNFLQQELWINYYDLQFDGQLNQDSLNDFVFQALQIKNNGGGAGQFLGSNITCINCTFSNILAMDSFILDITTKSDGNINFMNISVNQVNNNLKQIEKSIGCFNIQAQNSKLHLRMINISFTNIFNRMGSAIFTIQPSKTSNSIYLLDVSLLNCLSLLDQIFNIKFSSSIAFKNKITIKNLRIIQNHDAWILYFSRIGNLTIQEVTDISNSKNSLMFLQSCIVNVEGFTIEGIVINSIFQFENIPKLQLNNVKIENVQLFYYCNLVQITLQLQIQSIIKIGQLSITNISIYNNDINYAKTQFSSSYYIRGCTTYCQVFESLQKDYLFLGITSLQQINNKENSLIYLQSISNQNIIFFKDVTLNYNNCQQCSNGMVFIETQDFQSFKIQNLNCNYNLIQRNGCLYILSLTQTVSKIEIESSNFLFNNGSQGVAIQALYVRISVKLCKIIKNYAEDLGGGIYIQANYMSFIINRSLIIGNSARIGGGIYLKGDLNLNKDNFVSSFLLFNIASEYGDNIVETPTHLAVYLNYLQNPSITCIINNTIANILTLRKYRMIEQGNHIYTNDLIIPSNQVIKSLQIFDFRNSNYHTFVQDIRLFYKNSRNEILFDQLNSTCKVTNKIITRSFQELYRSGDVQKLFYEKDKNSFDFGSLSFSLDPYEQTYDHLQIEINCQIEESRTDLLYIIKAKSLKCQLGEYYINGGCQICDSKLGYYSVKYNATKCSIFDKEKYSDITSNMIKMQPGFWRPNNLSDYVEPCFKNPQFCNGGWQVGDYTCREGHIGALCEECDIYNIRGFGKYFKNQWNLRCLKCQFEIGSIISIIIVGIWSFASIFLSLKSIHSSNLLYAQLMIGQRYNKLLFKLNQNHESIMIKMLLNYLWIFSVIFTFNLDFSFSFLFIEQTSNSSYFISKDLDCQISSIQWIPNVYLKILTMIILMVMQFNITFIGSYFYLIYLKQKYDLSILSNTVLYLYVFNFAGLFKMFSTVVSRREVSNIFYIHGDVSRIYGTQDHQLWMVYFIIPGLIIIGFVIPLLIFLLLAINKNRLEKIKIRRHISYLLNEYRIEKFYWEQIKLFKKAILIFILTNFETEVVLKASLLGLSLLMYQKLATFHQPFINQKFNNLDIQSSQICSISILLALTKYICEQKDNFGPSIMIQFFIIACFIKMCCPFIFDIARNYIKFYKFLILNKLHQLLNSKVPNFIFTITLRNILEEEKQKEKRIKYLFMKLKDHLISFSRLQIKNSKRYRQFISFQSSRIHSAKSSTSRNELVFFQGIAHEDSNKRQITRFERSDYDN
ncbi:unnamed protein product [Paramecium octaurelia]|uniref:Transmembrane protein n=1 Tax=Paramecium octaurelia TaxID=43137 RepID=A0A8S1W102_PAROT|nr:unnamed protein product [Paramecium octaurelia]